MPEAHKTMAGIARQVRVAFEGDTLDSFADLLDPDVHWGAPDDPQPSCQNRQQVLAWFRRGRDRGVRARVCEVIVIDDRIVVGLGLTVDQPSNETGREAERWQVLSVREGRVVDIVAFDHRSEAVDRARSTTPSDTPTGTAP